MLTVLLSTRNGAGTLPGVLNAFANLQSPPGGWQLVIVDNGSTDRTNEIVASFEKRLPVRLLHETHPGKNAALNTGLTSIEGDLVVLTDDDVFPRADWLTRLRAAADAHPECSVFGGKILPRWEMPPAAWMISEVPAGPTFTLTDAALADGPTGAHNVFGPNMAVRASVFESGARFDVSIGPRGSSYPMGSETEFVRRLLQQGHRAWYVAEAVVEHFIRKSQMNVSWILQRAVRYGRGQYRLARAARPVHDRQWRGVPRYLYRQKMSQYWLALKAACLFERDALFRARWNLKFINGEIIEARLVHGEAAGAPAATASREFQR